MDYDKHLKKLEALKHATFDHVFNETDLTKAENYIPALAKTMSSVHAAEIHGFQKKEIVEDVMAKLVNTMQIHEDDKQVLQEIGTPGIGTIIDKIIAASKGYLFLNDPADDEAQSGCICGKRRKPAQKKKKAGQTTTEEIVDNLFDQVKGMTKDKPLDFCTIVHIAVVIMQSLDQFFALSGEDKKCIVVTTLHKIVNEAPPEKISDTMRAILNRAIDMIIPTTINIIVAAVRGELSFSVVVDEIKRQCC